MKRFTTYAAVTIALLTLCIGSAAAQQRKPRLMVNIVVSSMRSDDLTRYADNFSTGGFRRLTGNGLNFTNASYDYMQTTTPVSLATLTTGAMPSIHGVVADSWFDYISNKRISLIEDTQEQSVNYSSGSGSYSPRNLMAQSLSDALHEQSAESRIATIAVEPLTAIIAAGHSGEVYWMEKMQSMWTTSSYYAKELPKWVDEYNQKHTNDQFNLGRWEPMLPYDSYHNSQVSIIEGLQSKNNKRIDLISSGADNGIDSKNIYQQMCFTPAGNRAMIAFAQQVILREDMGKDESPDMINIILDSPRMISQRFGPESVEYEDMLYRLDRELEDFISFLHLQVENPNDLIITLTSDHGSSPSYNSPGKKQERFNVRQTEVIVNAFIGAEHGNGEWVLGYIDRGIYLNHNLIIDKGLSLAEVQYDVATFVMQLRGVSHAVASEAMRNSYFGSGYGRKIQNGYYPRRSGDIIVNLMPDWIEEQEDVRSSSGSMYRYDTQVPLIIYGGRVANRTNNDMVDMTSLAATQAQLLGINAPSAAEGEELTIIFE